MQHPIKKDNIQDDGPLSLAWRISAYSKDSGWIRAMVLRDYGRAPSAARIREMIEYRKQYRDPLTYAVGGHGNPITTDEAHRAMMEQGSRDLGNAIDRVYYRGRRCDTFAA